MSEDTKRIIYGWKTNLTQSLMCAGVFVCVRLWMCLLCIPAVAGILDPFVLAALFEH